MLPSRLVEPVTIQVVFDIGLPWQSSMVCEQVQLVCDLVNKMGRDKYHLFLTDVSGLCNQVFAVEGLW